MYVQMVPGSRWPNCRTPLCKQSNSITLLVCHVPWSDPWWKLYVHTILFRQLSFCLRCFVSCIWRMHFINSESHCFSNNHTGFNGHFAYGLVSNRGLLVGIVPISTFTTSFQVNLYKWAKSQGPVLAVAHKYKIKFTEALQVSLHFYIVLQRRCLL